MVGVEFTGFDNLKDFGNGDRGSTGNEGILDTLLAIVDQVTQGIGFPGLNKAEVGLNRLLDDKRLTVNLDALAIILAVGADTDRGKDTAVTTGGSLEASTEVPERNGNHFNIFSDFLIFFFHAPHIGIYVTGKTGDDALHLSRLLNNGDRGIARQGNTVGGGLPGMGHISNKGKVLDILAGQGFQQIMGDTGRPEDRMSDRGTIKNIGDSTIETCKYLVLHVHLSLNVIEKQPPCNNTMKITNNPRGENILNSPSGLVKHKTSFITDEWDIMVGMDIDIMGTLIVVWNTIIEVYHR